MAVKVVHTLLATLLIAVFVGMAPEAGAEQIEVKGITRPLFDITLGAFDSGVISEINIHEGDSAKAADVLFVLEHSLEKLEVERRRIIMDDRSELHSAEARVTTLETIYLANKKLYEQTMSISEEEIAKLELELVQAKAALQGLQKAEEREKVEFEIALAVNERKIVKAPIDGVITEIFIEPGESYEAPNPVLRIVSTHACLFVCNVEERWGQALKKGDRVSLRIANGSRQVVKKGTVVFVSPVLDSGSELLDVKIEFSNADGAIRPGASGLIVLE